MTKNQSPPPIGRIDPVCGKHLAGAVPAQHVTEYKKRRYYFCSAQCQERFHRQTEQFHMRELARAGALMNPSAPRWGLA